MGKSRKSREASSQDGSSRSLDYDTMNNELSRLSDVQEEFSFMNGQLEEEPDDQYNIRNQLSQTINESINDVKRAMLNLMEDPSNQKLYDIYKERENIALDYINAYFGFLRNSPQIYGDLFDEIPPYTSIAFYPEQGTKEPVI